MLYIALRLFSVEHLPIVLFTILWPLGMKVSQLSFLIAHFLTNIHPFLPNPGWFPTI